MAAQDAGSPASRNGPPLIQARGLTKYYGTIVASEGVDFDLGHGEIVAIVGDNGAGKSTLVKMISGAVTPDAGEIRVEGRVGDDPQPDRGAQLRDRDDLPGPGDAAQP